MQILIHERNGEGYKFYCPKDTQRFVLYLDESACRNNRLVLKCVGCPLAPALGCVLPVEKEWDKYRKSTTI